MREESGPDLCDLKYVRAGLMAGCRCARASCVGAEGMLSCSGLSGTQF